MQTPACAIREEFSEQVRQVEIKGEAFFEVRKDEKKPFIVQTDGIGIRVLGTTFNVDAEPEKTEITSSYRKNRVV